MRVCFSTAWARPWVSGRIRRGQGPAGDAQSSPRLSGKMLGLASKLEGTLCIPPTTSARLSSTGAHGPPPPRHKRREHHHLAPGVSFNGPERWGLLYPFYRGGHWGSERWSLKSVYECSPGSQWRGAGLWNSYKFSSDDLTTCSPKPPNMPALDPVAPLLETII